MAKTKAQPKPVRLFARALDCTIPVQLRMDDTGVFRLCGSCGWIGDRAEIFIEWEPPQPREAIRQTQAILAVAGYSVVHIRRRKT